MCEKRFNIEDIANIHNITPIKAVNGEVFAICPFCGDARGKFSYVIEKGRKKDVYNCFACGESGGALKLHMQLSGENFDDEEEIKKACREIYSQLENGNIQSRRTAYVPVKEAERASLNYTRKVYKEMLKHLSLSSRHKNDLIRRGLTEEQIKQFGFKSVPDDRRTFCRKLRAAGLNLEGIPGFYLDKYGKWNMQSIPGYFCPVYDDKGIIGFQIRADEPKGNAKYLWFSSAGKEKGASSGGCITRLRGKSDNGVTIVTEGVLKATVIYCLLDKSVTVVGVPGVAVVKSLPAVLKPEDTFVFEAYDMDKAILSNDPHEIEKTQRIEQAAEHLRTILTELGIPNAPLKWDMTTDGYWKGNYKGLDDFLLAYDKRLTTFLSYIEKKAASQIALKEFLISTENQ